MIFTLDNITVRFHSKDLLKKITLSIPKNRTIALLGPNGAGKTTLLKVLARIETPSEGHLLYDTQDVSLIPRKLYSQFVSYCL